MLAQDTGFSRHLPTGEGLLAFSTLEEAVAGVEEIGARPARHARAARELAEEHFDAAIRGRLPWQAESDDAAAEGSPTAPEVRRLNWGCGTSNDAAGWVNSDIKDGPGIDVVARHPPRGCRSRTTSFDYVVSIHALPELPVPGACRRCASCAACSSPAARCASPCPTCEKASRAYLERGDRDYFLIPDEDVRSLGGKMIVQLTWYGYSRSLFTPDYVEELLYGAGFVRRRALRFQQTDERAPRDRRARQPRAGEPLRRGHQVT